MSYRDFLGALGGRYSPTPNQIKETKPRYNTFYRANRKRNDVTVSAISNVARQAAGHDNTFTKKGIHAIANSSWNKNHIRYVKEGYTSYKRTGPEYKRKYASDPLAKVNTGNMYPVIWVPDPLNPVEPEEFFNEGDSQIDNDSSVTTGPRGPRGFKGEKGDRGPAGKTGQKGPAGIPGIIGPIGPPGATGPAGPTGKRGPRGIPGPPGASITNGSGKIIAGPQGPKGDPGARGPRGSRGQIGPAGPIGPRGPAGTISNGTGTPIAGPAGPRGFTGKQGPKGDPGMPGQRGERGERGFKGARGEPGSGGTVTDEQIRKLIKIYMDNNPVTVSEQEIFKMIKKYLSIHGQNGGKSGHDNWWVIPVFGLIALM
jgi:hypothetical protein